MSDAKVIARCLSTEQLVGKSFASYFIEDDYWHLNVFLRTVDGEVVEFFNHPTDVANKFEVFPIDFKSDSVNTENFIDLEETFVVKTVSYVWRSEWSIPGLLHKP